MLVDGNRSRNDHNGNIIVLKFTIDQLRLKLERVKTYDPVHLTLRVSSYLCLLLPFRCLFVTQIMLNLIPQQAIVMLPIIGTKS